MDEHTPLRCPECPSGYLGVFWGRWSIVQRIERGERAPVGLHRVACDNRDCGARYLVRQEQERAA